MSHSLRGHAGSEPGMLKLSLNLKHQDSSLDPIPHSRLTESSKNMNRIGVVDPLLVGRAQVIFEQGEHVSPRPAT